MIPCGGIMTKNSMAPSTKYRAICGCMGLLAARVLKLLMLHACNLLHRNASKYINIETRIPLLCHPCYCRVDFTSWTVLYTRAGRGWSSCCSCLSLLWPGMKSSVRMFVSLQKRTFGQIRSKEKNPQHGSICRFLRRCSNPPRNCCPM